MHQPIPGVTPSELAEVTCKVVLAHDCRHAPGPDRRELAAVRLGWGEFFTLGKLLALATIPLSVAVFGWQLMPYVCRRYSLTNRRIIIRKGLLPADGRWISLDDFDSIQVEVLPGQSWFHAGDLVFRHGDLEVLRLTGVARPETFATCMSLRADRPGERARRGSASSCRSGVGWGKRHQVRSSVAHLLDLSPILPKYVRI